jgi:hypothetical protein
MGNRDSDSCRKHFRELKILPLTSEYLYSLTVVIKNRHHFEANTEVHNINDRTRFDLHHPSSNLSVLQRRTYYARIKVFNKLPAPIKDLSHNITHSFYTMDEYFNYRKN